MKNKKVFGVVFVFLLSILTPTYIAWANDDEGEHEYEEHDFNGHENEYKYNDEENEHEHEYEYNDEENKYQAPAVSNSWDVWTRTVIASTGTPPFKTSKNVNIYNQNGKSVEAYVIPKRGEVMVPAEKIAKLLGANVQYFKTPKIIDIQLNGIELAAKEGSNALYENNVKTPMPVEAYVYQDKLYLPISVLTSGLGFKVVWDGAKNQFTIQN